MKKMLRNCAFLALSLAVLTAVGCGGPRIKGLVPAQGVVTLNDEPVDGAMVMFMPVQIGGEAVTASTTTDSKGAFKMTTLDPGDGVHPGDYIVTVVKDELQGGMSLEEARIAAQNPDEARKNADKNKPEATVIHHVPVKYGDMNTTDLKVSVPEGGQKDIQIKLEGEVDLTPQKQGGLNDVVRKR